LIKHATAIWNEDVFTHGIYAVDATTGKRTVFSSNLVGTGDAFEALRLDGDTNMIRNLLIAPEAGYAIEAELMGGRFMTIDLATGNRKLFSDSGNGSVINAIRMVDGMTLIQPNNYLLSSDSDNKGIYAVDVVTGERVVFSKSL
jgi:hypothetical protein